MRLYLKNSGKNPNPNYVPPASIKLKRLLCKHNNENEVVCWHWTHGINDNEIRSVEVQLKCNDCGKYHSCIYMIGISVMSLLQNIKISSGLKLVNQHFKRFILRGNKYEQYSNWSRQCY